jgi:hypothetical protein
MSDLSQEVLDGEGLYLAAAARLFPRHRRNRPVSPSTLFRWIVEGVRVGTDRRVHLEAVRISGKYLTTRGAIRRFLEAQTPTVKQGGPIVTTPTRRRRERERVGAELDRRGY